MAKKISASVGKGGKNKPEDTQLVQELLNGFASKCGFKKLDVDGLIGPKTIGAIGKFQKTVLQVGKPDSRVDPNGESIKALVGGPKKAEAEAKKAEKEEKKKQAEENGAQPKGKPQIKGDTGGLNKRLLKVLEEVSAHYGKPIVVESGRQARSSSDGNQLWMDWASKLKRGKRDAKLKNDERLRRQLDDLYNDLKKDDFLKLVNQSSGGGAKGKGEDAHVAGRAIDIKKNTDSKVVAALSSLLRREDEGGVIHFDDTGKSLPTTITEEMKKKWK